MQKCHKCGEILPDNNRFCPYCGTQLTEDKNESKVSKIEDSTPIQSKIRESLTIIKNIFDKYYPFYGVEIEFQIHLYNTRGQDVFLCFTEPTYLKYYRIYVDQKDSQQNYSLFGEILDTSGFDLKKVSYRAYDSESEKRAEEEYGEKIKTIYLATLINGGANDCIEREGKDIISEIKKKSYRDFYVYSNSFKAQSEALDSLSEVMQYITANTVFCSDLDLELHLKSTILYSDYQGKYNQRRIYKARYSFFGDTNKKSLFKRTSQGIFMNDDIDHCLTVFKQATEQEKKTETDRENTRKAKQKEREQEKLKMAQEAEKRENRRFVWMIVCMVVWVILVFVADYYTLINWFGWEFLPVFLPFGISAVGIVKIREKFGYA